MNICINKDCFNCIFRSDRISSFYIVGNIILLNCKLINLKTYNFEILKYCNTANTANTTNTFNTFIILNFYVGSSILLEFFLRGQGLEFYINGCP